MAASRESSDEFRSRLTQTITNGMTTLSISLGWQLGLFDVLCTFDEPRSSQEIADASGLREGYVEQWLGVMTVSGLVVQSPESGNFFFPLEHRVSMDLIRFSGCMAVCKDGYDGLLQCFRKDGPPGIRFGTQKHWSAWRAATLENRLKDTLLNEIVPKVPGLHERLERGVKYLDAGCGAGYLLNLLAPAFPKSEFIGVDLLDEELVAARQRGDGPTKGAGFSGATNLTFRNGNVEQLPADWSDTFDVVSAYDVIHCLGSPSRGVAEVKRILKPGGLFVMVGHFSHGQPWKDADVPMSPAFYTATLFAAMPGALYNQAEAGHAQELMERGCRPEKGVGLVGGVKCQEEMLQEAGFVFQKMLQDGPKVIFASTKPE